jgi:hypothetical protein
VIMGACDRETSAGRTDGSWLQPHASQVGSSPVQMPQSRSVPAWVLRVGQVGVYVLHRRLKLIESISEFHQVGSGDEDVVGPEAVPRRQMPCFECPLAMAAPAVQLWTPRALRGPESRPTPETPANR